MNEHYREKYQEYTDEELKDAISQLGAEISMGRSDLSDELSAAQQIAKSRGLNY
ncbi:MAG: hypothetical protein ABEH81_01510 [Halopenitus sp.]